MAKIVSRFKQAAWKEISFLFLKGSSSGRHPRSSGQPASRTNWTQSQPNGGSCHPLKFAVTRPLHSLQLSRLDAQARSENLYLGHTMCKSRQISNNIVKHPGLFNILKRVFRSNCKFVTSQYLNDCQNGIH